MVTRTGEYVLVLPNGERLQLTKRHTVSFDFGMRGRPNYDTQFMEYEKTGFNRLMLTMPDETIHVYGFTTCPVEDGLITPAYSDEALALYTES